MENLSSAQVEWLKSSPVLPAMLNVKQLQGVGESTYEILERNDEGRVSTIASRHGRKGFVLKVKDPVTGTLYAAKLAVPGDYREDRLSRELGLTASLREAGDLFICPAVVGRCDPPAGMPESNEGFVCFLAPWKTGRTLENFLAEDAIEPHFACEVASSVLKAIKYLERKNLKHDDLHAGNVMIAHIPDDLMMEAGDEHRLIVSVVDLGSLKPQNQQTNKSRDDWLSYLQILVDLFNGMHRNRRIASTHPQFITIFRKFIDKLSDDDITRHFPRDVDIFTELKQIRAKLDDPDEVGADSAKFQPFEAISAEHLANDSILLELFVRTLPWMAAVRENKPIVLTGPRGCGKSMMFRYLSIRTHLSNQTSGGAEGSDAPFDAFGVYISCSTHLQNNLSWLGRKEGHAQKRSHEIATYFQLVVLRELLKSLGHAQSHSRANAIFHFDESGFDRLIEFITRYFKQPLESGRLSSEGRLLHFADDIDALRVSLHRKLLADETWEDLLPDTFLADVTNKLSSLLPYFKSHQVVFLLDDYSANRVQTCIQRVLNKIVFERVASHFFKISCEKFGFMSEDIDGVTLDETREFHTIDTGGMVLNSEIDAGARGFVESLIDRRLSAAGWAGRAATLIGDSQPFKKDIDLAKSLRTNVGDRTAHYYGLDALGRLWSGDTATILQVVSDMFSRAGVNASTTTCISKRDQSDAIVGISKAFKSRVDAFHPYGPHMAKILGEFGAVIREVLVKGKLNASSHPYRMYRIEMTKDDPVETTRLVAESFPDEARLACELLRRAIFIELKDSRGKEGGAKQTMRWELRRIFNPAFSLSLERDSYLGVKDLQELRLLLTSPEKFADRVRASYEVTAKDQRTQQLFGEYE